MDISEQSGDPERDDSETGWLARVESLEVTFESLSGLEMLQHLTNLRRASFAHNELPHVDDIAPCRQLEELCLEDNHISNLDGLEPLVHLKKLDVSHNQLVDVTSIERLASISQLSLESNEISTLSGIKQLVNLMELYIGEALLCIFPFPLSKFPSSTKTVPRGS